MARHTPRWPTPETEIEKAKQGIIDDTTAAVSPLDLEEWEILGEPLPEPVSGPVPPKPKTVPERARKRTAAAARRRSVGAGSRKSKA